jgi:FAD-linked sulfhydryl oxidase
MFNRFIDPDSTNSGGYERRQRGTKRSDEDQFNPINENHEYSKISKTPTNPHVIDDNHLEKPCKACVDFKDWLKHGVTTDVEKKPVIEKQISINSECPLMRDDLGRASWSLLHTMAAYYPIQPKKEEKQLMNQFIDSFSKLFPCPECREDFQEEIVKSPPDLSSRLGLSTWMCQQHNIVNRKLGKPEFDCRKVLERWKDGPKDGRCD